MGERHARQKQHGCFVGFVCCFGFLTTIHRGGLEQQQTRVFLFMFPCGIDWGTEQNAKGAGSFCGADVVCECTTDAGRAEGLCV